MTTFVTTQLTHFTCCYKECGVVFGLEASFIGYRRDDHAWWYCPNGHRQHFSGKSETEKLQAELEAARRIAENERNRRKAALDREQSAERRRAAAKGQLTKTKNRIARGVCPCCNRTFQNLASHMTGQHPDYAPRAEL